MPKQQGNNAALSRRALIGAAAGPLLAPPAGAQNPPTGEQENEAAAKHLRANFERMRKVPVPMTVEPATTFRP